MYYPRRDKKLKERKCISARISKEEDKGNFTKKESLLEMRKQNSRVNANTYSFQKSQTRKICKAEKNGLNKKFTRFAPFNIKLLQNFEKNLMQ